MDGPAANPVSPSMIAVAHRTTLCAVFLTLLALPSSAFAQTCGPPSAPATTLRVLTYNIHHGRGLDNQVSLPRIAAVINSVHPDLVALQEVDSGTERTNRVDQPHELARLTGLQAVFGDNIPYQGGRYGNAVLSRLPILRHENHRLPSHYPKEQRGVLEVEVELPGGQPLLFFVTHFDYRRLYDRERLDSVHTVNDLIVTRPHRLALLAGDLNARANSTVLTELGKSWRRTNHPVLPTYPASFPIRQIDYVLVRPACRWRVREVMVLAEATASDHRALLTVLELRGE
jgi:endonuclease/exonuclease/phosphatase family metal-dependent hydrolase